MASEQKIYLITGYSGSGKSSALRFIEDLGFYCIDNLPSQMIGDFLKLFESIKNQKLAIVVDARSHEFLKTIETDLFELKKNYRFQIVFFDCSLQSVTKRFKESRLKHPLAPKGTIKEGYLIEKKLLHHLQQESHITLDTSQLNVHQLKDQIHQIFDKDAKKPFEVFLTSFGFRNGIPIEADHVVDVRFLSNPYFVASLRQKTGKNKPVQDFVLKQKTTKDFIKLLLPYLKFLTEQAQNEGKPFLNIAIGCTGGRHRSVTLVEYLKTKLKTKNSSKIIASHRDLRQK